MQNTECLLKVQRYPQTNFPTVSPMLYMNKNSKLDHTKSKSSYFFFIDKLGKTKKVTMQLIKMRMGQGKMAFPVRQRILKQFMSWSLYSSLFDWLSFSLSQFDDSDWLRQGTILFLYQRERKNDKLLNNVNMLNRIAILKQSMIGKVRVLSVPAIDIIIIRRSVIQSPLKAVPTVNFDTIYPERQLISAKNVNWYKFEPTPRKKHNIKLVQNPNPGESLQVKDNIKNINKVMLQIMIPVETSNLQVNFQLSHLYETTVSTYPTKTGGKKYEQTSQPLYTQLKQSRDVRSALYPSSEAIPFTKNRQEVGIRLPLEISSGQVIFL